MSADAENDRLPFEPKGKRQRSPKDIAQPSAEKSAKPRNAMASEATPSRRATKQYSREETSIPEVVSRRMLRRMLYFSGIPVIFGVFVFFVSYVLIVQEIAVLPNVVVLLTTLACFGLSVVGLSYGALSASWEEDTLGSLVGFEQFQVNFGRLIGSWRQAREERQNGSS